MLRGKSQWLIIKVYFSPSQCRLSVPKAAPLYKVTWESKSLVSAVPLEHVAPTSLEREQRAWGNHSPFSVTWPRSCTHIIAPYKPELVTWPQLNCKRSLECSHGKRKGTWWTPNMVSVMKYFHEGYKQCYIRAQVTGATGLNRGPFLLFCERCLCEGWRRCNTFMLLKLQHCGENSTWSGKRGPPE